ncbi:hypothetical protein S7711_08592 [Stachybotrys chartarum IBT 7711]|uniref:Zn(2)-C6 fungal-type domain-containing protein n=1 Tax=Stachybotrys chartarum (strain CBS 109288 / IBT 7711) TaxID=1280523 RepID=A0A084AJI3_STACB|nr:hypothetical protein S7711_08592 [Stachybotrys chartarum IBT 7711]KFA53619.1 hypothetical protein S40293_07522 [Stachybotrys chartarum IBT 40293]
MAQAPDAESYKRKRGSDDGGSQPQHHHHHHLPQLPSFLSGVLDRHESLAANLGAKLTGPRLLKGIEKFFDGPVKTNPPIPFGAHPVSWVDVVSFAKTNPNEFVLTTLPNGSRGCRFMWKGSCQVEVAEDDWRVITSGVLDRFPLERPPEEDETTEVATLEILEQRTAMLFKRAEEVAARARHLHHKIGHRRLEVTRNRSRQDEAGLRYQTPSSSQHNAIPAPPYDLHADLLQQYVAAASTSPRRASSSTDQISPILPTMLSQPPRMSEHLGRGSVGTASDPGVRIPMDNSGDPLRAIITQKIDKMGKGELITPSCDRCRRLKKPCVKHLTACQGCTKKHARCSWRAATDEEAYNLKREMGIPIEAEQEVEREALGPRFRENGAERGPYDMALSPLVMEDAGRPTSRGGDSASIMGGLYSPKSFPPMRGDPAMDRPRTSLPAGPSIFGGGTVDLRRAQISSILSGPNDFGPPYGSSSQPPSR